MRAFSLAMKVFRGIEGSEIPFLKHIKKLNDDIRTLRSDQFDPEFEAQIIELNDLAIRLESHLPPNITQ